MATYSELGDVGSMDASWVSLEGDRERFSADEAMDAFEQLRAEMADEHGVWFSATVIVQKDGSYEFSYNYTEPVKFGGSRDPLDESYVADLARHPCPWDEIPEWHPVKRDYSEESWAAALAKGIE